MDRKKNGQALILAVLVMALTLAAALALAGIVASGIRLSKEVDNSVVAFYAAESGIENNLYQISQTGGFVNCTTGAPNPAFVNGATWALNCTSETVGGVAYNVIRSTGYYRDANVALQVRIPQ